MKNTLLVTGISGFTGSFVFDELKRRGVSFDVLLRDPAKAARFEQAGRGVVLGDLNNPSDLRKIFEGYKSLINIASIGFGSGPGIVRAAEDAGIERAVFVGTTAIFTHLPAATKSVRQAAEDAIDKSRLQYTILRPTMIYGSPGDRNMARLVRLMKWSPVVAVPGDGTSLQQPVHVQDVAWAICEVLERPSTFRKAYNISGQKPLSFNEVVKTIASELGRKHLSFHVPLAPSLLVAKWGKKVFPRFPSVEQVLRLNENKAFDHLDASRDFGYRPRAFHEGIRDEIRLIFGDTR